MKKSLNLIQKKPHKIIKLDLSEYESLDDFTGVFNRKLLELYPFSLVWFVFLLITTLTPLFHELFPIKIIDYLRNLTVTWLYIKIFYYFILLYFLYRSRSIFCKKFKFIEMIYIFITSFLHSKTGKKLEGMEKFMGISKAELKKITDQKKLVVLIDEIDRSKPQVIHDVLLRLKQVTVDDADIKVHFVLCFDKKIVSKSIEEVNKAYEGVGDFFLEKICTTLEFNLSLEEPKKSSFFKKKIEGCKILSKLDKDYIKDIIPLLPNNPRYIVKIVSLTERRLNLYVDTQKTQISLEAIKEVFIFYIDILSPKK